MESRFPGQIDLVTLESTRPDDRPIHALLRANGLEPEALAGVEDAQRAIERHGHNLVVVVDLEARGIDALAVIRAVRRAPTHVPIILATDFEAREPISTATSLHIAHYLAKPVTKKRLMAEVAACAGYLEERSERERMVAEERAIGALLRLSLEPSPVESYLQSSLELLLKSVYWLALLPRSAIFRARQDQNGGYLEMAAAHAMSPELHLLCRQVPFGHCLCGRAASERRVQYAACVDHRHDTRFEGMQPHGHYNVPILHQQQVLGVMVFYLPHGHRQQPHEVAFLERVADVLSMGIIRRNQSSALEEATRVARDAVNQLESITRNLSGIIFRRVEHPDGRVEYPYVSSSGKKLGFFPSRLLREGLLDGLELVHEADRSQVRSAMAQARETMKPVATDFRLTLEDGTTRWMHCSAYPTRLDDGTLRWDGLLLDVEDRKSLEAQLLQAQKLEAVGQLAAGIAHEINTPTQYVSDNTHFLQEAFEDLDDLIGHYRHALAACEQGASAAEQLRLAREKEDEIDLPYLRDEIPQALDQALEGLDRVATIVRAMKAFSHPGGEEKEMVDINKLLTDTVTISRNEWKYVAEVELDLEEDLPPVEGVANQLGQVFLNLIVNAAHAIAGVGGRKLDVEGRIRIQSRGMGTSAEIIIEDNGPGIPEAIRDKVFNPFFTTKDVGKGTGQGLAIAHDIVRDKHGGSLLLEEAPEHGARFIIRLPLGNGATA